MKITSVKGANDYLPREAELRNYLLETISNTYKTNGFERIMTPILEDVQNLDKSEGGENLNLIFKLLKRGAKLTKALEAGQHDNLADMGLRYDLTLPLSRYFANNRAKLIMPMKCIQIDKVFRAERPQKGRLREFVQCDIDIIGSESIYSEIELITTTAKALTAIGIKDYKIKVNDRRLLKEFILSLGFEEEQVDSVCITIDKLDKIGVDGIQGELKDKEFNGASIEKLSDVLSNMPVKLEDLKEICQDQEIITSLETIINTTSAEANENYTVVFDLSLVRGQGYYTGTVFEIESNEFRGSIAGGGRYDNLIGKFLKEKVPAVGFSIGFERIFSILLDRGFEIPSSRKKIALFYDGVDYIEASKKSSELQKEYDVVLYLKPKKLGKFIDRLKEFGYDGFYVLGQSEEIKTIEK